jgi:hypothetical protein
MNPDYLGHSIPGQIPVEQAEVVSIGSVDEGIIDLSSQ